MRVGTCLENWRAAEKSLAAIEGRIADLTGAPDPTASEARELAELARAKDAASKLADKYWVLYLEDWGRTANATPK